MSYVLAIRDEIKLFIKNLIWHDEDASNMTRKQSKIFGMVVLTSTHNPEKLNSLFEQLEHY